MASRRQQQFRPSGDRNDILAIDGNAKLHRRTYRMPFAEVVDCSELGKRLLRGCSCRPDGKSTLCRKHTMALAAGASTHTKIRKHRLRRALHGKDDVTCLEVQLEGHSNRWQPACTFDEEHLAEYFARQADTRIQVRRKRRLELRSQGVRGKRRRKETSFMASWSSAGPRAASECSMHKEGDAQVTAAARTAWLSDRGECLWHHCGGGRADRRRVSQPAVPVSRYNRSTRASAQECCPRRRLPPPLDG